MNVDEAKAQLAHQHQHEYGQAHELDDAIGVVLARLDELEAMEQRALTAVEHAPGDTPAGHVARRILGKRPT